eukprot:jgi/Botrbrau1/15586/Bobra.0288s0005.1
MLGHLTLRGSDSLRRRPSMYVDSTCLHYARSARKCVTRALLTSPVELSDRAEHYNFTMNRQMGWNTSDGLNPYEYHPHRGLYYHQVHPNLFCGTQLRTTAEVDHLRDIEGIGMILNLQENKDFHYWGVDFHAIYHHAQYRGVHIVRRPAVDFDPHSLRKSLPVTVRLLGEALKRGLRVYVHCTAGLGRAPAVCIAYLYWYHNFTLDEAYASLTRIRPCGPKKDAIRAATYDLVGDHDFHAFHSFPADSFAALTPEQRSALQYRINFWE